jgi:ATP/ADP translocase
MESLMMTTIKTLKKYPLLSLMQIVAAILMFLFFFWTINFLVAVTPEEAAKRGYPAFPGGWDAAVMSHGKYYQWYTINNHLVFFLTCLFGFVSLFFFIIISGYVMYIKRKPEPTKLIPNT